MNDSHILFPDSKAPRCDQYARAWKLLLSPATREDERAHAKCWLTYRCADGEVSYADYLAYIKPVEIELATLSEQQKARWRVSLGMAQVCAGILNTYSRDWVRKAYDLWEKCIVSEITKHPPCLMTFTRLAVALAYDRHLHADRGGVERIATQTWGRYKKAVSEWDWSKNPFRPMEATEDMKAMQMLQFIGMENGFVEKDSTEWCSPTQMIRSEIAFSPFVRGIARMSQMASDKSRVIFPDPNKTEREVLADYAGDGLFVELGVAAGAFAERVLDRNRGMRYVGIDKWDDHHDVAEMEKTATKLSRFGGRAELKRTPFGIALAEFEDESCDVIYVDGYAHTGQDEGKTLRDWWPKVKSGGVFSGHDYDEKWPKTVAAVDAFAESVGAAVEVIKDEPFSSWAIRKPVK